MSKFAEHACKSKRACRTKMENASIPTELPGHSPARNLRVANVADARRRPSRRDAQRAPPNR